MQLNWLWVDVFPQNNTQCSEGLLLSKARRKSLRILSVSEVQQGRVRVDYLIASPAPRESVIPCAIFLEYINSDRRDLICLDAADYVCRTGERFWFASIRAKKPE